MKRRDFFKSTGMLGLATVLTPYGIFSCSLPEKGAELKEGFLNPPDFSKPHTFWFWMNGNVTKTGITRDLEAIKQAGVGGVLNFDAGTGMIKGPVEYDSPEYWNLKKHAISECNRLGLFFGMHNCPGWSSSGGPWVTPPHSMLEVCWSETYLEGNGSGECILPKPFFRENFYQDTFVLAYPALKAEVPLYRLIKEVTACRNNEKIPVNSLADDLAGVTVEAESECGNAGMRIQFFEPCDISYISFFSRLIRKDKKTDVPPASDISFSNGWVKLESSMDGVSFEHVETINLDTSYIGFSDGSSFVPIDIKKRAVRFLKLTSSHARNFSMLRFSGGDRIESWRSKANYAIGNHEVQHTVDPAAGIDPDRVIDLSPLMDRDGKLTWDAPEGTWTILRFGYTTKGTRNRAAPAGGEGLEIDKFSKEAMDMHFQHMMENLLAEMKPLAEKNKVFLEIDSWEVGIQNWTPDFPDDFKKRAGYDLKNYLPTLTGRVVGSYSDSDRFLWDFRKIQADLTADNYYGRFYELCREHGFRSYNEPYENGPFDELQIGSRVDVSMGEFWSGLSTWFQHNYEHRRTVKLCASIAHSSGRKIVGAEAFTAETPSGKWQQYPFSLKALGDKYFTEGLTRIVFHRYAMQPNPDETVAPGMTMAYWGMHFERTNTWWNQGRQWITYLSRCQYMLQQGMFVADLAYFSGEDTPKHTTIFREELNPCPPEGYDYDVTGRETILNRMTVKDGSIVLPDGMRYQILVLQDFGTITLELLQKIHALVRAGMVLVGAKPERLAGFGSDPKDHETLKGLTDELWGGINGESVTEHSFGKGRVFWGKPMNLILTTLGIARDFEYTSRSGDAPVRYIHRKTDDRDIYFICNERRTYEELVCSFRNNGKQPEIWDAVDGTLVRAGIYSIGKERISVPIQLKPYGSVFVVFHRPLQNENIVELAFEDRVVLSGTSFPQVSPKKYERVVNNFTICLWAKPEIDIMLGRSSWQTYREWTDYYAIYPPSGRNLYGNGHETSGLTIGRNGVAVWHRESEWPYLKATFPAAIEGWTHVSIVYHEGVPSVYLNGTEIKGQFKAPHPEGMIVHPGIGGAWLNDRASYYNGDLHGLQLLEKAFDQKTVRSLYQDPGQGPEPDPVPFYATLAGEKDPGILFWRNGNFQMTDQDGKKKTLSLSGIGDPMKLTGEWTVRFPKGLGAPEQIRLPKLFSLHKHEDPGVRYFSGTAVYYKEFSFDYPLKNEDIRYFLDLGRVEIAAEVYLNGKNLGVLWSRPYQVEITSALKNGINDLAIHVVNLWPNRLIGDEQLPPEYEFEEASADSGACIKKIPDWFLEGKPKPGGRRISFSTWKHYKKEDPLFESGLIGPVIIQTAIFKPI